MDGITDSMDMGLSKVLEMAMDREACCSPSVAESDTIETLN